MASTRVEQRIGASLGLKVPTVQFEPCRSLDYGGVLLLIPFLLSCGLMSYRSFYGERSSGYYDFDSFILSLAVMYLCRIKSIEQLKHYSPGELGKLIGLDRVPEARCMRSIFSELVALKQTSAWGSSLCQGWMDAEEPELYYMDGHVQVYHGYLAHLGKKHVSRQRLCLPAMMEFWINNHQGQPYFFVTSEVSEMLQQMLVKEIIPKLNELTKIRVTQQELDENPNLPRYTMVFDREGYSPKLFDKLWQEHRVAVITYRKNVKNNWEKEDFTPRRVCCDKGEIEMLLAEKQVEIDGFSFREIRKLNPDGHQTSVISTNPILDMTQVAVYMFSRWSQENFFRFMRQEYNLDAIIQYGVDQVDDKHMVVNREYSILTQKIKKTREKIARKQAQLYVLIDENIDTELEKTPANERKQQRIVEDITELKTEEEVWIAERKKQPYKIQVGQMNESTRYNKLKTESKHLQNIVKMICYRAETALAGLLANEYKRREDEIRALVKSIVHTKADIIPDYEKKTLTVEIYSLASNRDNLAVYKVLEILNQTETVFPNSQLKMIFKCATG